MVEWNILLSGLPTAFRLFAIAILFFWAIERASKTQVEDERFMRLKKEEELEARLSALESRVA